MSDYTLRQFATNRKKSKADVEKLIAIHIQYSTPSNERSKGMSVISLIGPNLRKHYDIYEPLLGMANTLHGIEENRKVYQNQLQEYSRNEFPRLRLHHNDMVTSWDLFWRLKSQTLFIDFDACKEAIKVMVAVEGLLKLMLDSESIARFAFNGRKLPFNIGMKNQRKIWLAATYTLRGLYALSPEDRDKGHQSIIKCASQHGWTGEKLFVYSYRDQQPMETVLFKFVKTPD